MPPKEHKVERPGKWLPDDHRIHQGWLEHVVKEVDESEKDLHIVIEEFKQLIENNTRLFLLASEMLNDIPNKHPYNKDPSGKRIIRGYEHLLKILNYLLTSAPEWNNHEEGVGLIGKPVYAILDWPMGTTGGFAFFLDPEVNHMLKKVLNEWGRFLQSSDSKFCLGDSEKGWFGPTAYKSLCETGNLPTKTDYNFEELYQCPDPNDKYRGFTSWDHFFTREFNWDLRPVVEPDNEDAIANVCESEPYRIAYDVKLRDQFWAKGMPYSVTDIFQHDSASEFFVGGTIYQAFLSALSYHRWHSPVNGTIKKVTLIDGTYYSEPLFEDFHNPEKKDGGAALAGESVAQAYLTAVAARALFFIEADNPAIGLCCVVQIGMSEVSSCDVSVEEGQRVKKGDEIGMFHFGGSTWCLLLRKGVKVKGLPEPEQHKGVNVPVRSKLAEVVKE